MQVCQGVYATESSANLPGLPLKTPSIFSLTPFISGPLAGICSPPSALPATPPPPLHHPSAAVALILCMCVGGGAIFVRMLSHASLWAV